MHRVKRHDLSCPKLLLPPPSHFSKNSLILLSTRYGVKKTLSYFSGPDERKKMMVDERSILYYFPEDNNVLKSLCMILITIIPYLCVKELKT
jgi:hypothetical protein